MKTVFVSIINYNGTANTLECLKSLNNQKTSFPLCVLVVDNGSKTPFSVNHNNFKNFRFKLISNKDNLGFSGGHNTGIRFALEHGADYVLLLNNDTLADSRLIEELVKVAETDRKIGIIGPKIYFSKGYEFHKDRYTPSELGKVIWYAGGVMDWDNVLGFHRGVDEVDKGQYDRLEETQFVSGCCMLIKKEVFQKIGFLDERYFLYYEDIDYNERVRKGKYTIMYVPTALIWHKNAASAGGSGSNLQDYYITRNRMLLGFTYAPFHAKTALIRESLETLLTGRKWQRRGIIDFYMRKFGKGSYRDE